MSELSKEQRLATKAGAVDELSLQNAIRVRYKTKWPSVILELNKRIQAVNQTWNKVMWQIMNIPGLSVTYSREGENLLVTVFVCEQRDGENNVIRIEETERHEITIQELMTAGQYIEVLIMDKLDKSELIARLDAELMEPAS